MHQLLRGVMLVTRVMSATVIHDGADVLCGEITGGIK